MFRSPFLFLLVLCLIGLLSPSLVQGAPASPRVVADDSLEQTTPIVLSDENDDDIWKDVSSRDLEALGLGEDGDDEPEWKGISRRDLEALGLSADDETEWMALAERDLEARGWISNLSKLTKNAKDIVTAVGGTVAASKEVLSDITGLAKDAKSATTAVKKLAQNTITELAQLPSDVLESLKDETKTSLENKFGKLSAKAASKISTAAGLDERSVSLVLVGMSGVALEKLSQVADKNIAKLSAVAAHASESINSLFEAPAADIENFLTRVEENYLQVFESDADDYLTKAENFCELAAKYMYHVNHNLETASTWTKIEEAAADMFPLVLTFYNAQDKVISAEDLSELSNLARISVAILGQLSEAHLSKLDMFIKHVKSETKKRETSTAGMAKTLRVAELIEKQQDGIPECEEE